MKKVIYRDAQTKVLDFYDFKVYKQKYRKHGPEFEGLNPGPKIRKTFVG